ncbi:MAG: hypothetical protein CW338_07210 [Clostridiales bacterium]|nr:hypothetical protein [Clostridiales bacterium]
MRNSHYLKRFLIVLVVSILLTAAGSLILSSILSNSTYTTVLSGELLSAHQRGRFLAESFYRNEITAHDCQTQFDSVLNSSRAFWIIYDKDLRILACSGEAKELAEYLCDPEAGLQQLTSILDTGTDAAGRDIPLALPILMIDFPNEPGDEMEDVAVTAERVGDYVLVTGLPHALYEVPFSGSRLRLLIYIPLLVMIVLLISTLFTRSAARPALQLIEAADLIKQGQRPVLPEDLHGEAGDIATAFNYLTATVAETMSALQYEKETLGLVIEGLHEGIMAAGSDGGQLFVNSAARHLLGSERSEAWQKVENALQKGGTAVTDKIVLGERVLQYTVSPLPKRDGKSAGRVALIRDITEQELLENTRHDYVANISHELRTPLASIRGLGEGLRDGLVTDEKDRERYYNIIVDEANRLSRLVNDLLELSGLQSNPAAFETEKVDLTEMLYDLYDLNGSIFEEKSITFTLDVPETPLPAVISNEDRLSQVLTILLDNARKYTPEGGSVTLGGEPEDGAVRIYVRDTGIGMDEETRKMAFERFHQAEKSHSEKGSGLGLAIAREVMKKLGITIRLESEPGKGSEFSFEIPLPGAAAGAKKQDDIPALPGAL